MKTVLWIPFLILLLTHAANAQSAGRLSDPLHILPGATRPFGSLRISPDTGEMVDGKVSMPKSGFGPLGYYPDHTGILGFSHSRIHPKGARETGVLRVRPETRLNQESTLPLSLIHKNEVQDAGFYSIVFPEARMRAELTATGHCGIHRYSLLGTGGWLAIEVDPHSSLTIGELVESGVLMDGLSFSVMSELRGGYAERYQGFRLYAYGEFNFMPKSARLDHSMKFEFEPILRQIELRVCFSPLSLENAREFFKNEVAGQSFDTVKAAAVADWQEIFR